MENENYMREGLDLKKIFLLFMNKLWIIAAAVIAGAVLGTVIYLTAHFIFAAEKEYRSVGKFYLNFNCEPEDFNELAYNGYTWNDLMASDPILDYTMDTLPAAVSREEVKSATKAEILSDIRLLTVTITTGFSEKTMQIMAATEASLLHLGETDELFQSIEVYGITEPELIVWDNRTVRAAMTGALIALFAILALMLLYYILDDSLYVEAEGERKYGLPVLGIFTANESGSFQSYGNEFAANYNYLCKGLKGISLMSVDCAGDAEKTKQIMEKVLSSARTTDTFNHIPVDMPEDSVSVYDDIRLTDGVILTVRFGNGNGKRLEREINNLQKQDCNIIGIIITEADENFLKKYYMGMKRG